MLRETCWVDGSEEARFFTLLIAVEEILNETRQCHLKDALKEILDQLLAFRAVWSRLIVQSLDDLDKLIDIHLLFIFLSRQNHLLNFDQIIDALSEELVSRLPHIHRLLERQLLLLAFNNGFQSDDLLALLFSLKHLLLQLLNVLFTALPAIGG